MDIKIVCNNRNRVDSRVIKQKLIENGFNVVSSKPDIVFVLGGDGTFLREIRNLKYDKFPLYVGINCGNLGYLQDILLSEVDSLIRFLSQNNEFSSNKITLATISYYLRDGSVKKDNAINELQISGKHYHKIKFELTDCREFKETILSSGIVFATPYGSTAYNKSLGGPVICEGVNALCATLFAPIQNSKTKDYIQNSLIGDCFSFKLLSDVNDVEVIIDGQNISLDLKDIEYIKVQIGCDNIFKLKYNDKSYSKNMLEKMIKDDL